MLVTCWSHWNCCYYYECVTLLRIYVNYYPKMHVLPYILLSFPFLLGFGDRILVVTLWGLFGFKFYLFRWESSIFVIMFLSVDLCLDSRTQNLINYDLIPILVLVGPNPEMICSVYWQYRHFLTRALNFRIFYFWAFTAHKSKKGKIVSIALVIWFSDSLFEMKGMKGGVKQTKVNLVQN